MAAPIPQSSVIGALMRLAEQDKSQAPHAQASTDQPSSPQRTAISAPLESPIAPESPESARVISTPTEGNVTPSGTEAVAPAPSTGKVGGIGGPGAEIPGANPSETPQPTLTQEDVNAGRAVSAPVSAPQAAPPTFDQWKATNPNGTSDQYLASVGRQDIVDFLGGSIGVGLDKNSLRAVSQGGGTSWKIDPVTGAFTPEVKAAEPNNATLQDYLNQGKTAQQWYAETGRQGELDTLTKGATQPIPSDAAAALKQGVAPTVANGTYTIPGAPVQGPPNKAGQLPGQVLGASTTAPATTPYTPAEFIGPQKPLLPESVLSTITNPPPSVESIMGTPAPTPTPASKLTENIYKIMDSNMTEEQKQQAITAAIADFSPETARRLANLPTPTPTPAPGR